MKIGWSISNFGTYFFNYLLERPGISLNFNANFPDLGMVDFGRGVLLCFIASFWSKRSEMVL